MKSRVIHLPDISGFHADPELTTVVVTEADVQEQILHLAKEHGEIVYLDSVAENCGVICENEAGRKVLLYPHLEMPGAGQAEQDVKEKKVGDRFDTVIGEKKMTLTVNQILLHKSCEIDDTLALRSGKEGVSTLEELKKQIADEKREKTRQELCRMLVMEMQQYLCENAETDLDEDEVENWAKDQARLSYEENMEMGIDLRFTEEGDMLTEEEVVDQLAADMRMTFVSMLVNQKFCQDRGFTSDKEGIEADNEYFPFVYQELTKIAEEMLV